MEIPSLLLNAMEETASLPEQRTGSA